MKTLARLYRRLQIWLLRDEIAVLQRNLAVESVVLCQLELDGAHSLVLDRRYAEDRQHLTLMQHKLRVLEAKQHGNS